MTKQKFKTGITDPRYLNPYSGKFPGSIKIKGTGLDGQMSQHVTWFHFTERWPVGTASWDVSNFLAGSNFIPESKVVVNITSCLGVLLKGNDVFRFMLYAV